MKDRIINCPNCHSRKYKIIAVKRGFSFDKAMTGAILGGVIGGHGLELSGYMGIGEEKGRKYYQCEVCAYTWA